MLLPIKASLLEIIRNEKISTKIAILEVISFYSKTFEVRHMCRKLIEEIHEDTIGRIQKENQEVKQAFDYSTGLPL